MGKNSFVLYTRYSSLLSDLDDKEVADITRAVFHYVSTGELPELKTRIERLVFSFIKDQLDFDGEKYEKVVKRNRENGKKHISAAERAAREKAEQGCAQDASACEEAQEVITEQSVGEAGKSVPRPVHKHGDRGRISSVFSDSQRRISDRQSAFGRYG